MSLLLNSVRALAALVLVPTLLHAQSDPAAITRIRAEGIERSKIGETFNHLVNVIGPRLAGTPAYKASVDYAALKLKEWGMTGVQLEPWTFGRGWTLEKLTLEMTAPRYYPLVGYPEAWTPSTKGVLTGKPIYLGDKTAAEIGAMGEQLRGAIILASRPQTVFLKSDRAQPAASDTAVRIGAPAMINAGSVAGGNNMEALLRRYGAGAILKTSQGEHGTIFVLGTRTTPDTAVPQIVLTAEHYNQLVRMVQSNAVPTLRVEVQSRYHSADNNSYNVIAEIPGEDPVLKNEIVLLGAHIDSWHSSAGATDNADGAATMMEAMRILKAANVHPKRTIRMALWGGEEEGLLGSKAYVAEHLTGEANAAARAKIALYLNEDPGSGPTYGFYMQNNEGAKTVFDAWLEPLKDLGMKRNVIGAIGNTDHLSFDGAGIPGFNTIKDYDTYDVRTHHTNVDSFERVSEADLKQSATVMAIFAYQAAMHQGAIPRPAGAGRSPLH